jgi:sulfite reductase beta subunit-like hemoprotein
VVNTKLTQTKVGLSNSKSRSKIKTMVKAKDVAVMRRRVDPEYEEKSS